MLSVLKSPNFLFFFFPKISTCFLLVAPNTILIVHDSLHWPNGFFDSSQNSVAVKVSTSREPGAQHRVKEGFCTLGNKRPLQMNLITLYSAKNN